MRRSCVLCARAGLRSLCEPSLCLCLCRFLLPPCVSPSRTHVLSLSPPPHDLSLLGYCRSLSFVCCFLTSKTTCSIARQSFPSHLEVCVGPCTFEHVGCPFHGNKDDLERHEHDCPFAKAAQQQQQLARYVSVLVSQGREEATRNAFLSYLNVPSLSVERRPQNCAASFGDVSSRTSHLSHTVSCAVHRPQWELTGTFVDSGVAGQSVTAQVF